MCHFSLDANSRHANETHYFNREGLSSFFLHSFTSWTSSSLYFNKLEIAVIIWICDNLILGTSEQKFYVWFSRRSVVLSPLCVTVCSSPICLHPSPEGPLTCATCTKRLWAHLHLCSLCYWSAVICLDFALFGSELSAGEAFCIKSRPHLAVLPSFTWAAKCWVPV